MKLKDVKIITGWTNDMGNIFLLYRLNGKKHISTVKYPWYFYIKKTDKNLKLVNKINKLKIEIEGEFIKIYYDWTSSNIIMSTLFDADIQTYEADLSPLDLLILDKDIQFEDNFRKIYFDIETDDRAPKIVIGRDQIISFAYYDGDGNEGGYCGKDEKKLLLKIKEVFSSADIIIGYYSSGFDLPYIKKRFDLHRISFNWNTVIHIDMMYRLIDLAKHKVHLQDHSLNTVAKYFCGENKYDYPGSTWECMKKDKNKLFKYNLRDAELLYLIDKKNSVIRLMALEAKWCNALLKKFWVSKLCDMFILSNARKKNVHYKTKPNTKKSKGNRNKYIGGFVIDPSPGLYKDVYVFDFKMMYSAIIRTLNVSIEKKLEEKTDDCIKTLAGIYFDKKLGITASIIGDLMEKRYDYKDKMKECKYGSAEYESYRLSQEAIKQVCNSIYGILGDVRSRYYDRSVASSITLTGRFMLKLAYKLFGKFGYKGIYGDTDSVFVIKEKNKAISVNDLLANLNKYFMAIIKKQFNVDDSFIRLEYEHKYDTFFILTKKRYAGYFKKKGDKKNVFDFVGLEVVKRDYVLYGKEIQKKVLEDLLTKEYDAEHYHRYLMQKRKGFLEDDIDKNQIMVRQKVVKHPDEYASKLPHVSAAKEMIKRGKHFLVGMLVEYIIKGSKPRIVPILPEDYDGEFDRDYYWNHKVYPMTERVLECVFKDIKWDELYVD